MATMANPEKINFAELEGEDDDQSAQPKHRFSRKLIVIIAGAVAGVLVLAGAGTAGYLLLSGSKEAKVAAAPAKPPVFVDVPEVLVNMSNVGTERTQYLKVRIVLEIPDALMQPQIQSSMPRVMDAFQTYLRELRPTDLDGSAGLYRLKEELTRRVNAAISPNRVNAVLFKEIVVQ
jgi:flagellar protein FliL